MMRYRVQNYLTNYIGLSGTNDHGKVTTRKKETVVHESLGLIISKFLSKILKWVKMK